MMGMCLALCALGFGAGVVALFVPRLRRFSAFAFLLPLLSGIGALALAWGLAVFVEKVTGSSNAGGLGFFGGYAVGGLGGAVVGFVLARRIKVPQAL